LRRIHFCTFRSELTFSQKLVLRPTRPSNINFETKAIQMLLAKISVLAPLGPTSRFLKSLCRGLPGHKYELLSKVIQMFFAKLSVLTPFCPTDVTSKARPQAYPALKYQLRSYSRSEVRCQGLILAPFGPTLVFSKARAKTYPPSNMNFVALAIQKFTSNYSPWHLLVRPALSQKLVPRPIRLQTGTS
jgi:hypothetical protein